MKAEFSQLAAEEEGRDAPAGLREILVCAVRGATWPGTAGQLWGLRVVLGCQRGGNGDLSPASTGGVVANNQ